MSANFNITPASKLSSVDPHEQRRVSAKTGTVTKDTLWKRLQHLTLVWQCYQLTGVAYDSPWLGWFSWPLHALTPHGVGTVPRSAVGPVELQYPWLIHLVLIEVFLIREALDGGKELWLSSVELCRSPELLPIIQEISGDGLLNTDAREKFQLRQNEAYYTGRTGEGYHHQHNSEWYVVKQRLGTGAAGQVERVRDKWTAKVYARKTIFFRPNSKDACLEEVRIMQRLHHPHIVRLISTCVKATRLEILMLPVADEDLDSYLTRFSGQVSPAKGRALLRSCFGCLASGLAYLHRSHVRHKDIKPKNILVRGSNVLYTDFGIAREFVNRQYHTTTGLQRGTLIYAAPELVRYDRRNTSADVFSLGCVYMEMLTCLSKKTLSQFREYRTNEDGNQAYHANIDRVQRWSILLEDSLAEPSLSPVLDSVRRMLRPDATERPKIAEVALTLTEFPYLFLSS
ncbi:MAG: hypothetical protein M1836_007355 [Candelina mexicana]|nr:MAG: hypothetical protein M1836_007355 [Candelina mexicana]